jgi:DNA polymerase-1
MQYIPEFNSAYQLLHEGILALAKAEQNGIRVDTEYIQEQMGHLNLEITALEEQVIRSRFYQHWKHSTKGQVNMYSGTQLATFLYKVKKLKVEKETTSGMGSTDDETLRQLADNYELPVLKVMLKARKLKRVKDTYLAAFEREQVNQYLHTFFNLHLVTTYRSSSDHPNFQNIPKRDEESMQLCRRALYPRPGHQLLEIDYSGLEVRIAACYHKDPTMLKYIKDPHSDMHADMAKQLFLIKDFDKSLPTHGLLRQAAKNGFVFPEFYGDYYKNCAINMACNWGELSKGMWSKGEGIRMEQGTLSDHFIRKGIHSLSSFEEHVRKIEKDFWGRRFPIYAEWKDSWWEEYKKKGYIELYTGFRCSGVMGKNDCINYPVQGAAFHCLLWSFIQLDKFLTGERLDTRLVGQIHDSILLDVNPSELNYVTEMAHKITCFELPEVWKWIIVPLDIDADLAPVDASWADKEKYRFK